jgi:predicted small integral membrane protein
LSIGFVWVVAFSLMASSTKLNISRKAWARWASPPAIFFLAVALMLSGVPGVARFELSRGSLDQAAASAPAGNHVGSGWIGLIDVYDVRVLGDATFFDTSTPESGEGCAFVKFAGAPFNWSPDTAWNPHYFGGGWWYGCTGMRPD